MEGGLLKFRSVIKVVFVLCIISHAHIAQAGLIRALFTTACTYTGAGFGGIAGGSFGTFFGKKALSYLPACYVKNPKAFLASAQLYGQLGGMVSGGYWAWSLSTVSRGNEYKPDDLN